MVGEGKLKKLFVKTFQYLKKTESTMPLPEDLINSDPFQCWCSCLSQQWILGKVGYRGVTAYEGYGKAKITTGKNYPSNSSGRHHVAIILFS